MVAEYISDQELRNLISDLQQKLEEGGLEEIRAELQSLAERASTEEKYIDQTYLAKIKDKKRLTRITEITNMLQDMTPEQVDNVYVYTVNEFDEPNHEAVALEAIIKLSKSAQNT